MRALFFALSVAVCSAVVVAQTVPRTPWGDPDLQGIWPSGQLITVPFERPVALGTRALLSDQEYAQRVAEVEQQAKADATEFSTGGGGGVTPPSHWLESGRPSRQASLIVDPPDGRLPPMTDEGKRRAAAWPSTNPAVPYARAQDFNIYDRCVTRGVLGSTFPNIYSSGIEIHQAPGQVVLRYEMIHETRIIPLDGRPHIGSAIRSYMGDARGRWEGQTLVVESTNFNGKTGSLARNGNGNPTSEALKLVERFTRRDAETLEYSVTVTDPSTWTRPWTVAFSMKRDAEYVMYKYACHEGNYAIRNILSAFRAAER